MTEARRLYQQIADQVRQMITTSQYPPGTRLPPERELAQQLGVSRASLREALIALEIEGAIEIRMGSGIYVLTPGKPNQNGRSLGESPMELMQARAVIESALIVKASAAMTDATLSQIRDTIEAMRHEIEQGRKPLEQDRQFHILIAEAAANAVLSAIVANLFDERHSPISHHIRGRFETPGTWRQALAEHEAILACLEARDPLDAQSCMYRHLIASGNRWLES